ncbi:MAG: Spy/CpxP family protein refolding chaperone [Syntrophobacteraceae bacterium]
MKRVLTGFAVCLVAAVWMAGSWFFFNSIAIGAQGSATPAVADADKAAPKGEAAAKGHCGCEKHWMHHGHRHGHHPGHHHLWKKLHITDAQKTQIHAIISEERAKMKPLFEQLKAGHKELRALRESGTFDEAKVRSIAKGQADTIVELIVTKERIKSRVYAVLTPEQRTKAQELREKWKACHGKEHMKDKKEMKEK